MMQVSERTIEDVREALRHEPISAYPDFVAAVSAALDDRETLPVELDGVADAIAYGKGVWRSCSGCHETNEGVPLGPYSSILKCHLGGGCFECGGIGAIWDTTDYADMGRFMAEDTSALPAVKLDAAALNDFRKFVDLIEGRAMACDGPVTPFLDELSAASEAEKERFIAILRALYASPANEEKANG